VQNPYEYGYQSVRLLNDLATGDASVLAEGDFISIPGRQIRKDNVDAFWADLKEKTGKE
jgi:ribose transport system substrate-binding protein